MLPTVNGDYGKQEYWLTRFENEDAYEWLCDYQLIKPVLDAVVCNRAGRSVSLSMASVSSICGFYAQHFALRLRHFTPIALPS